MSRRNVKIWCERHSDFLTLPCGFPERNPECPADVEVTTDPSGELSQPFRLSTTRELHLQENFPAAALSESH